MNSAATTVHQHTRAAVTAAHSHAAVFAFTNALLAHGLAHRCRPRRTAAVAAATMLANAGPTTHLAAVPAPPAAMLADSSPTRGPPPCQGAQGPRPKSYSSAPPRGRVASKFKVPTVQVLTLRVPFVATTAAMTTVKVGTYSPQRLVSATCADIKFAARRASQQAFPITQYR